MESVFPMGTCNSIVSEAEYPMDSMRIDVTYEFEKIDASFSV